MMMKVSTGFQMFALFALHLLLIYSARMTSADVLSTSGHCTAGYPECVRMWQAVDVPSLYHGLITDSTSRYVTDSACRSWNNCQSEVERDGCTLHELVSQALQYDLWSRNVTRQRYKETVDAMDLLCNVIYADYSVYQPCYNILYAVLRDQCRYGMYHPSLCRSMSMEMYCYAKVLQQSCSASAADVNVLKTLLYLDILNGSWTSCLLDFNKLLGTEDLGEIVGDESAVTVRLAGENRLPNAGRLEIYYNKTWGTLCGFSFGNEEADVACAMLGFRRSGLYITTYYGGGSGPIWLDYVTCVGSETSLVKCRHSQWGVHVWESCTHAGDDVSIICDIKNCTADHPGCTLVFDTELGQLYRKVFKGTQSKQVIQSFCGAWSNCNAAVQHEGCTLHDLFFEVKHTIWAQFRMYNVTQHRYIEVIDFMHHLCSNIEPDYDVYQQCFQSGLLDAVHERCGDIPDGSWSYVKSRTYCYARVIQETCNTSAADVNMWKILTYYARLDGYVGRHPSFMDINELFGNVTDLNQITSRVTAARIVSASSNPRVGRLQVYFDGVWGEVCHSLFTQEDANVACYMLGFGRQGSYHAEYRKLQSYMWPGNFECIGNETSLADCRQSLWTLRYCVHMSVTIDCGNVSEASGRSVISTIMLLLCVAIVFLTRQAISCE